MKDIKFSKKYNYNSWNFEFEYLGNNNIAESEKSKINLQLENLFKDNTNITFLNINEIVTYLRTIFKNCPEILLNIKTDYPTESLELSYEFRTLFYFKKIIKQPNSENIHTIEYDIRKGIIYKQEKEGQLILKEINHNLSAEILKDTISNIEELNKITKIELTANDYSLIRIYELFYGVSPDFNNKKDLIRINNMCYLLWEYGINLETRENEEFNFSYINGIYSANLDYWLKQLKPIGNNYESDPIPLYPFGVEKKIESIRNSIFNLLKEDDNLESLTKICNIIYLKKHVYPNYNLLEEIKKTPETEQYSEEIIEKGITLLKQLDKKENCDRR